jgi:uncharacterized protein YcbK (DUF882 family)
MFVSQHFRKSEFDCPCCGLGGDAMDPKLLMVADAVRKHLGPLKVSSGYRCEDHNELIGSTPRSQHRLGTAGDFTFVRRSDINPVNILRLYVTFEDIARKHLDGYGIGLYNTFVHFDVRNSRARWESFDWPRFSS